MFIKATLRSFLEQVQAAKPLNGSCVSLSTHYNYFRHVSFGHRMLPVLGSLCWLNDHLCLITMDGGAQPGTRILAGCRRQHLAVEVLAPAAPTTRGGMELL